MLWGIDLGGTKIEGVVVSSLANPEPICRHRIDTEAGKGYNHILTRIFELVQLLKEKSGNRPTKIGIAHPGVLDPHTGLLKNSNTLCLNGRPLFRDLEARMGVAIGMANDANCFALAESVCGAARGSKVVFGVIMGTGVGGGIVVNGEVLRGAQGIAGEWGHNVLEEDGTPCYCGKKGCVETVISGPALEQFYKGASGQHLSLSEIVERARSGEDLPAVKTISRLTFYFGKAIANVINILDPDVIVLGGGVSNVPELLTDGVAEAAKSVFHDRFETRIVRNMLGDSAGVFGAAFLAA